MEKIDKKTTLEPTPDPIVRPNKPDAAEKESEKNGCLPILIIGAGFWAALFTLAILLL